MYDGTKICDIWQKNMFISTKGLKCRVQNAEQGKCRVQNAECRVMVDFRFGENRQIIIRRGGFHIRPYFREHMECSPTCIEHRLRRGDSRIAR